MNQNTVPDYASLLNHQIIIQEKVLEHHLKAEVMLKVFLEECRLRHYATSMVHCYFWELGDHISEAKRFNENLLRLLMKMARLLDSPQKPQWYYRPLA